MIITRTPLRITLGGGGSDLENGLGACLSATINKYVTVTVTDSWSNTYRLRYSQHEEVGHTSGIQHRIIRRVFERFNIPPGIEISSHADIPAGTGLGSSGAFTVGLLKALFPEATPLQLAGWASDLDIGQQDQWSAAFGGVNIYDFAEQTVQPVDLDLDSLSLWFTGMRHNAGEILTGPGKPPGTARQEIAAMRKATTPRMVGDCLSVQWANKFIRCPSREHRIVDGWLKDACEQGAYGGKLVGAGNGGFILLCADRPIDLPLRQVPFTIVYEGARCV